MMSKYIELLNKIKEECTSEWLTKSQLKIFNKIAYGLEVHKLINIFGDVGLGKTFIGWIFQKSFNYVYINDIKDIPDHEYVVLDDNIRFRREDTRILRPIIIQKNIRRMVLLTRTEVQDDIPSQCLTMDHDDKKNVCSNLYKYFNFQITKDSSEFNLRDLIIRNLK